MDPTPKAGEPALTTDATHGRSSLRRFGATHLGVWLIKHLVAPLDRRLYRWTGGRLLTTGRPLGPILLLTTKGRKTGVEHTNPVFYLKDGDRLIICNVNPGFEKPNPWTLNIRANPIVTVQVGSHTGAYAAREASPEEVEQFWPQLVQVWPAYQTHYERSGKRVIFILEPCQS